MSEHNWQLLTEELNNIGVLIGTCCIWKNGPGLNIFETAFKAMDLNSAGTAALQALAGTAGGFFAAPQFDASFIR